MVRYAQGAEVEVLDPAELSERLAAVLRDAMPWLVTISEAEASVPEREGKWSAKEGYEQMAWVKLEHYAEREWAQVLALWFALNEHIAWTIGHVEKARLANRGVVAGEPLTLGFLIEDYVAHMEHHLRAMRLWLGTVGEAAK